MADEDKEPAGLSDAQMQSEISACSSQVDKLLAKNDKAGALLAALQNPPVTTKTMEIKARIFTSFV